MPESHATFLILSTINAALALAAAWLFAGEFVDDERRWIAVFSLVLTPLYTFLAFKFNANTALLALWPLVGFTFLRSLRTRHPGWAIAFGLAAAAAMLAKYYSGVLLLGCVAAALVHRDRRAYFTSPAPYLTLAVFGLALAPHAWWYLDADGSALAAAVARHRFRTTTWKFLVGGPAYSIAMTAILLWLGSVSRPSIAAILWPGTASNDRLVLWTLLVVPFASAPILATLVGVGIDPTWHIAGWFALPVLIVTAPGLSFGPRSVRRLGLIVAGWSLAVLASAPVAAIFKARSGSNFERIPETAQSITSLWRQEMKQPLRLLGGTDPIPALVAFYSPDHPSEFVGFDRRKAPWVTPERIRKEGLLVLCVAGGGQCLDRAAPWLTSDSVRRDITVQPSPDGLLRRLSAILPPPAKGRVQPVSNLVVIMVPPAPQ